MMVDDVMVKVVSDGRDCDHGSINNPIEFAVSPTQEQEIEAGNILNSFFFIFIFWRCIYFF
jgi:hypothetical protein